MKSDNRFGRRKENKPGGKKGVGMKWRVFRYIALFAAVFVLLLWLFQTVFFDGFYKAIKLRRVQSAEESIRRLLAEDSGSLSSDLAAVAKESDICLLVYNNFFQPVVIADVIPNCTLHKLAPVELRALYMLALENGGRYDLRWGGSGDGGYTVQYEYSGGTVNGVEIFQPRGETGRALESVISVETVTAGGGQEYVIFLNAVLSPVNETVRTLRVQLICISVILLMMAAAVALVMSRRLAKPLTRMTGTAERLSSGDYDLHFDNDTGYLEIDKLGNTLNRAAKELARADHLRSELLANISHDLRTPLTMITGCGEVMRDIPGECTAENIDIIVEEAKRLSDLVSDAMDISKLKAGEERLFPEVFSLTGSVREITERIGALMRPRGYSVSFAYDREYFVTADPLKISQVVYNLINNGLNYAGEGGSVSVRQTETGGKVQIDVADTGPGISDADLPFIFDRYYKGESRKRAAVGTGLGLAIVKAVLEIHGAEYGVTSEKGAGSDFWFRLPAAGVPLSGDSEPAHIPRQ